MPRKTPGLSPPPPPGAYCFNEAAARCRGKLYFVGWDERVASVLQ